MQPISFRRPFTPWRCIARLWLGAAVGLWTGWAANAMAGDANVARVIGSSGALSIQDTMLETVRGRGADRSPGQSDSLPSVILWDEGRSPTPGPPPPVSIEQNWQGGNLQSQTLHSIRQVIP